MAFLFQTTFRPLLALTWQEWRPLATSDGVGVGWGLGMRMGWLSARTHPLCVHITKEELQTPSLWPSVPLPLVRMKHPSYRQFSSQNKRLEQTSGPLQGRQDQPLRD